MAVYSKIFSDDKLLSLLPENVQNIFIITCGGCANESLAYDNDHPVLVFDKDVSATPYASYVEAKRIATMLETKGFNVNVKTLRGEMSILCVFSKDANDILNMVNSPDVIITISCVSGALGLQLLIPKTPVIPAAYQVGYISYTYKDEGDHRKILKDHSSCLLFEQK